MSAMAVCGRLRALAEQYEQLWAAGTTQAEAEALVARLCPAAEFHTLLPWAPVLDARGLLDAWTALHAAMPGCYKTVDAFTCNEAEGLVSVRYTFTGCWSAAPLWGLPPHNKLVSVPGVLAFRSDASQRTILRFDNFPDIFSAAKQLGVDLEGPCAAASQGAATASSAPGAAKSAASSVSGGAGASTCSGGTGQPNASQLK
jgi:hypothetical protein